MLEISVEERIRIAHNSFGSRVFDVFLDSATVSPNKKRQLVLDFIGHYHHLVDDKVGSRVGDRCWEFSDTYLKVSGTIPSFLPLILTLCRKRLLDLWFRGWCEQIGRAAFSTSQEIPSFDCWQRQNEPELAASFYGKFFAKNLNLYLLRHRPEEWRNLQSGAGSKRSLQHSLKTWWFRNLQLRVCLMTGNGKIDPRTSYSMKGSERRRKSLRLLLSLLLRQVMCRVENCKGVEDRELEQVLGAIRLAPKSNPSPKRNKDKRVLQRKYAMLPERNTIGIMQEQLNPYALAWILKWTCKGFCSNLLCWCGTGISFLARKSSARRGTRSVLLLCCFPL